MSRMRGTKASTQHSLCSVLQLSRQFQACIEAYWAKLMLMMMKCTHIVIMGWICLCEVDKQVIVVWTKKKREDGGAVEVWAGRK